MCIHAIVMMPAERTATHPTRIKLDIATNDHDGILPVTPGVNAVAFVGRGSTQPPPLLMWVSWGALSYGHRHPLDLRKPASIPVTNYKPRQDPGNNCVQHRLQKNSLQEIVYEGIRTLPLICQDSDQMWDILPCRGNEAEVRRWCQVGSKPEIEVRFILLV